MILLAIAAVLVVLALVVTRSYRREAREYREEMADAGVQATIASPPAPPLTGISSPGAETRRLKTPRRRQSRPTTSIGLGLCGVGSLVALIAGIVLQKHFGPIAQVCSSGLGALGQTFSSSASHACNLGTTLAEVGHIVVICGVVALGACVLCAVLSLFDKSTVIPASGASAPAGPVPKPRAQRHEGIRCPACDAVNTVRASTSEPCWSCGVSLGVERVENPTERPTAS